MQTCFVLEVIFLEIEFIKIMSENKKLKSLIEKLSSGSDTTVIDAVNELREHGGELSVAPIIETLVSHPSERVKSEIIDFLFDLKSEDALKPLIAAIADKRNKEYKNTLISALWHSSLDASDHLTFLVEQAITGDYLTCLEVLTVVENLNGPFDNAELETLIDTINEKKRKNPETTDMLEQIESVLKNFLLD